MGSSPAPEVKVKITAEDTGVAAAIKALGDRLSELKTQSKDTAASFGDLKSILGTLVSAEAVYKIAEFGKEVFDATLNIERMSQRTGLSAGLLSTFAKAAEQSGASTEQVNTSLGKLAASITKFQQGGTQAAAAMKALGVSQADLKNLSPDEKIRLVTDRLGSMHDGLQKATIAQQLMGRGGQVLIPTLDALAGQGFDKVTEAAKRSGQYISDEMAADAATAAAAFAELEGAGKGMATQFEAGLIPAITDVAIALTDSVEGDGGGALKTLGEYAGLVVKGIVLTFQTGSDLIGAIFLGLYDIVKGIFDQIGNVIKTSAEAAIDVSEGRFKDAGKAIATGVHTGVATAKSDIDDLKLTFTATADLIKQQAAALFPSDAKKASLRPKRTGPEQPDVDDDAKGNKARLSLIEARLQEEGVLFKAKNAQQEAENEIAYDKGLESLKAYFARRKQLAQAESDEQISVFQRQRAAVSAAPTDGTDAGGLAKKQKLEKLDNEIAVAKVQATTKQEQLDQQLFTAEEAHQKTLLGYQAQILALQGLTYEAAIAKIQSEEVEVRRSLAQSGLSSDAVDAMVAKIQQLKSATAAFDEDKKQGEEGLAALSRSRDTINLQVTAGLETQYGAKLKIAQLELQEVPQLEKIAAAMHAAAISPEQVKAADDFSQKIKDLQINAAAAANQMQQFGKQVGTAIQGDVNTFLTSTIMNAKNVGDAFRQLAGSVVGSIQKIVTSLLIQIVTQKLLQAVTHQSDDPGQKVATSAAAGIAQATPLMAASTAMGTAGGVVETAATTLGASATALQLAANTLLLANEAGGSGGGGGGDDGGDGGGGSGGLSSLLSLFGGGNAAGGLITGPGTETSDSIPARLSTGEFVMRASSVREIGVDRLAAMNRGLHIPGISGKSIPRFAEGGLVQGGDGRGGTMDLKLGLGLDHGLVLHHLESKAAGKVILQHIANNPKAAGKALQRGGR